MYITNENNLEVCGVGWETILAQATRYTTTENKKIITVSIQGKTNIPVGFPYRYWIYLPGIVFNTDHGQILSSIENFAIVKTVPHTNLIVISYCKETDLHFFKGDLEVEH
jgi:hypothetical protein